MTPGRIVMSVPLLILMLSTSAAAWGEPLGRLFLTPERRGALERQRQFNIQAAQTLEGSSVSLDGVVVRSSGKNTVWVNHHPQTERAAGTGVTTAVSPGNPTRAIVTPGDEAPTALRVGESINRATRERTDNLAGGRISVNQKH